MLRVPTAVTLFYSLSLTIFTASALVVNHAYFVHQFHPLSTQVIPLLLVHRTACNQL